MRSIRALRRCSALLALVVGAVRRAAPTHRRHPAAPGDRAREPRRPRRRDRRPAGQVEIRWYCCLGGGDAPEQVEVEKKVAEAFNAAHPNIHLTFEAVPYAGARDALATQIALGQRPGHRRAGRHRRRERVPRPVARPRAAHRQDRLRPEPVPRATPSTSTSRRRGPGRHPVRDLPVGPVLQEEPVRGGRSQRAAARVRRASTRCPTAPRSTGTTTRSARSPSS